MARALSFIIDGTEISTSIEKVERAKLYGRVEKKQYDRSGDECYLGSLSGDGMHIFGRESFEQGYIRRDGEWVDKAELLTVDDAGEPMNEIESSFKQQIDLKETTSIDDYLLHCTKSIYQLFGDGVDALLEKVRSCDALYSFPFNYTKSYQPDIAFLVENEDTLFMIIAARTELGFVGPDEADDLMTVDSEEDEEDGGDPLDFSMM